MSWGVEEEVDEVGFLGVRSIRYLTSQNPKIGQWEYYKFPRRSCAIECPDSQS